LFTKIFLLKYRRRSKIWLATRAEDGVLAELRGTVDCYGIYAYIWRETTGTDQTDGWTKFGLSNATTAGSVSLFITYLTMRSVAHYTESNHKIVKEQ
jgi:hypothetical protein